MSAEIAEVRKHYLMADENVKNHWVESHNTATHFVGGIESIIEDFIPHDLCPALSLVLLPDRMYEPKQAVRLRRSAGWILEML